MQQRSLVAFYGEKPAALVELLEECCETTSRHLGKAFVPYDVAQIHATLIGLESLETAPDFNRNFAHTTGVRRQMNVGGFLSHVRQRFSVPIQIRIGSFGRLDRPFVSRGQTPYKRSFSVQGTRVVLMGWPVSGRADANRWDPTLFRLRRDAESFGIEHAYHATAGDHDNDFYMRLGTLAWAIEDESRRNVEACLREQLAERHPCILNLAADQISVVEYADETLPLDSTRREQI